MTDTVRVFVNASGLDVPAAATALDAVRAWNAEEADAVSRGARAITDSRGLPVAPEEPVYAGAILRLVGSRAAAASSPEADDVR
jgi:hypothetical protein